VNRLTALNEAQRKLVAAHLNVVKWVIYRHIKVNEHIQGLGYDDLFQEGCLCLCGAASAYDGKTARFDTYARVVVRNGLFTYCKRICGKQRDLVSTDDVPGLAAEDFCDALLSDTVVFGLLKSVKAEYAGVVRLGIEALELKAKGFTGAEIARMWGVQQNHVGAWITRAKQRLRQNERFLETLKSA
jgi:RNA polymerase sigma factor (sigma-70 family)